MSCKKLLIIGCCVTVAVVYCNMSGLGQANPADEAVLREAIKRCDDFLTGLPSGVDQAYEALLKDGPLREKTKLDKVAADTRKLFLTDAPYGKLRKEGVERVKTQRVGNDLALLRYLQKFENMPVVWYFTFYRTGERWVLITVRFDHEYELLGL